MVGGEVIRSVHMFSLDVTRCVEQVYNSPELMLEAVWVTNKDFELHSLYFKPGDMSEATSAPVATEPDSVYDPEASTSQEQQVTAPISKRQAKKAAKRAAYEAAKPERRAREKAARKEKLARARAEGSESTARTKRRKVVPLSKRPCFNCTLCVDLGGWDDKMSEREMISLTSQLCYCYNTTRCAKHKYSMLVAHWSGRVKERMEPEGALKGQWRQWHQYADIQMRQESLEQLLESNEVARDRVVYLTADSPNVLESLTEHDTYVLGGIVDKNRYKVRTL